MNPSPLPWATLAAGLVLVAPSARGQCTSEQDLSIGGVHNPFLAGQPAGTAASGGVAPGQSPFLVPTPFQGGTSLHFLDVAGDVHLNNIGTPPGPDGDINAILTTQAELGISGYRIPADALLGVFLPATGPNAGPAPADLDFSTLAARDFDVLYPELYQIFFIGDGLRAGGVASQTFVAPALAESLYLGSADNLTWADNTGSYSLTVAEVVPEVVPFCTAKVNSKGCLPTIGWSGTPDLFGVKDFVITCSNVLPGKAGMLFYGWKATSAPFQGGYLCTKVGIRRTRFRFATGSGTCGGVYSIDFDAYIRTGANKALVPGARVYAQWWMRDAGSWSKTGLSDALSIQICQ